MEHTDIITLPIALLLLAMAAGPSFIVIFITLPVSALLAMVCLYPFSLHVAFGTFTPSIFASLLIAMSIDCTLPCMCISGWGGGSTCFRPKHSKVSLIIPDTLFLLSRYREEITKGKDNIEAVTVMVSSAGKTVMVSGMLLGGSFVGLAFVPLDVVKSIGIGGFVTIASVLLANLTLTPSLLILGEWYFKRYNTWASLCSTPPKRSVSNPMGYREPLIDEQSLKDSIALHSHMAPMDVRESGATSSASSEAVGSYNLGMSIGRERAQTVAERVFDVYYAAGILCMSWY